MKSAFQTRMEELEKRLGKGQTFAPADCRRILDGIIPMRVLLGSRVLKGDARKVYQKAVDRLIELEKEHGPAIDMAAYGSGGAGAEDHS
jgi:hypothetical protein